MKKQTKEEKIKKLEKAIIKHDENIIKRFKERILMSLEKRLGDLEDKDGNALRPNYNEDYWKGVRNNLHESIDYIRKIN